MPLTITITTDDEGRITGLLVPDGAVAQSPDPCRWLVTINGRVVTVAGCDALGQGTLAAALVGFGSDDRSEFANEGNAEAFRFNAAREFPEDDVRLWAQVSTTTSER